MAIPIGGVVVADGAVNIRNSASRGQTIVALLVAALFAGRADSVRADFVVANNFEDGYRSSRLHVGVGYTDNGAFSNEAAAQRFVAERDGVLTTIAATIDRFDAGDVPLIVGVHTAAGTVPGMLLGSITAAPSAVSPPIEAGQFGSTFDFSGLEIDVSAGQSYFVTFAANPPLFGSSRYRALLLANHSNSFGIPPLVSRNGGASWEAVGVTNEVGLLVHATNVPEPVAVIGLVVVVCRARRRRR